MLKTPAWPLCNMAVMLFLTGPYSTISQLIDDMPTEIDIASITYREPAKILTNCMNYLNVFETFKMTDSGESHHSQKENIIGSHAGRQGRIIVRSPSGKEIDSFDAVSARAKQDILDMELEMINSFLCSPCGCTLCCTGPGQDANQEFFEIPLSYLEKDLFDLPVIDSEKSVKTGPYAEDPLKIQGKPFYYASPAIYNWHDGWSMVLTRNSSCPALSTDNICTVYENRPMVCRKPQIFASVLERTEYPHYVLKNSLLAVWDCPYVRHLEDEIANYAALNETRLVFRGNKT